MTPRTHTALRMLARTGIAASAVTGVAGGVGVVVWAQAKFGVSAPPEPDLCHRVDGAVGDPSSGRARRVVWLGDSLAAGVGAISADVTLPRLVAAHRVDPTHIHSFATPGATAIDVVRHQLPALAQLRAGLAEIGHRVDAIGVSVGGNDVSALTTRRSFRRLLHEIIDAADGTPVVFLSIPQLADALRLPHPLRGIASGMGRWLDGEIRRVAAARGAEYASVRTRPEWIRRRDLPNFLAADRFHPSGAGYAVWSGRVADAFERVLAAATP